MTTEKLDPARCKQSVYVTMGNWGQSHQCYQKPVRDGFCKIHHPEAVAERRQKSQERFDRKHAALMAPHRRAEQLEKRVERLEREIEEAWPWVQETLDDQPEGAARGEPMKKWLDRNGRKGK